MQKSVKQITEATKTPTGNSDELDKRKDAYIEVLKKLGKEEQRAAVADMLDAFTDMGLMPLK